MGGESSKESEGQGQMPLDPKEAFNKIDKDKSGTLDKAEIKEAMQALGKSDAEIKGKLDAFGKRTSVKFDEFKALLEGKNLPDLPDAAEPKSEAPKAKVKNKDKSDAEPKAKAKSKGEGKNKETKAEGKKGKDEKGGKGKGKDGKGKSFEPPTGPYGSGSGFRLNVKNLADGVEEEKLKEMFAPFGEILGCEVKKQDNGKSRGFGFVVLSSEEEGKKAMLYMNGKDINGKALNVGPAERRENPDDDNGKGKGKGMKGKEQMAMAQHQQQYMAAAYMQQYQQYYYLQQMAMAQQYQQQAQGGGCDPAKGKEYEGSLKSVSVKNGYGFIVCQESFAEWGRDVYVDKEVLPPGVKVADRMKFTVELNAKGHPRASSCYPAL